MHFNQIHTTTRVVCLLLHVYVKITSKTNASLKICLFFKIPEKNIFTFFIMLQQLQRAMYENMQL